MIKKNICVSIVTIENKSEEVVLELRSSNTRSEIVLEPRLPKLILDLDELREAIKLVEDFSVSNPSEKQAAKVAELENPMVVEIGVDEELPF